MTAELTADPEPPIEPPAALSPTRPFYWSVRREIWEHRSLYVAPLIVATLVLFGFVLSTIGLPHRRRALMALDPAIQAATVVQPYDLAAIAIILTMFVVGVVYCLGALHGERRDRSLLFWKSLPVSDLTTVLAKAAIPLAALPAIAFAVIVALQLTMLLLSGAVLAASGVGGTPSTQVPLGQMSMVLAYGLVTLALWWAPLYGWLLLVSGWAKRVPFLWAVLPPVALCLIEKVAFNTTHLAAFLGRRLIGGFGEAFVLPAHAGAHGSPRAMPAAGLSDLDPVRFLGSPGLWVGLAVAAGFLAAAVWLRRRQGPL